MCGIQMVPVPSDLLALPFTLKSDPLRGPIFIPLDTECLMANKRYLFEGSFRNYINKSTSVVSKFLFPPRSRATTIRFLSTFVEFREDTYAQRLFLFQEAILQRFGFVPCLAESAENDHQYVHITGNAFILVPSTTNTRPRPRTGTNVVRRNTMGQKRYPVHPDQPSPHEAYITRYVGGKNKDDYSMDRRVSKPTVPADITLRPTFQEVFHFFVSSLSDIFFKNLAFECLTKIIIFFSSLFLFANFRRWGSCGPGITWSVVSGSHSPPRPETNYSRRKSYKIFDISALTGTTDSNNFGNPVGS